MPRKLALLLAVLTAGLALDQATKLILVRSLPAGAQVPVIPGFFNLVHIYNRGAAFGLLSGLPPAVARSLFLATTALVLAVVGYLWWRLPDRQRAAALGYSLIITGALGNFIDRLRLGEVIDFLDFYLGRYHWPAFNLADSLVCLGAGVLVWVIFRREESVSHPL
jgi:signal peptidase II